MDEVPGALAMLAQQRYPDQIEQKGASEFFCGWTWIPVNARTESGRRKQQAQNRAISDEWGPEAQLLSEDLAIALREHISAGTCARGQSDFGSGGDFSRRLECNYFIIDQRMG
jgi:hypothetical protein